MCISCEKIWTALHVLWSVIYVSTGAVQIVTGIFFVISIPIFRLSSNIWAGSWNVLVGIGGGMLACFGKQSAWNQELLLYFTITIIIVNTINAVISEWHFFLRDNLRDIVEDTNLYSLIFYARLTTGICAAAVIITAFVDSQLTYCAIQTIDGRNAKKKKKNKGSHEQVSDIEYIIPRPKNNSIPKSNKNAYNAYAQSWVFDADATVSTNNSESPYLKLDDVLDPDTKMLSVSPTKQSIKTRNGSIKTLEDKILVNSPVVHIEEASDDSNSNDGNRKLYSMKSFSRMPSPNVLSASSSQISLVNNNAPQIYECLERLTEPTVYRSRLSTAISERDIQGCVTPCKSPVVRDRSPIGGEKVQYASLMQELQQQFLAKKEKFQPNSPPLSTSESVTVSDKSSRQESSRTDPKSSDAEFSKELEAALQLIQDLESPNTIETPSEPCRSVTDERRLISGTIGTSHPVNLAVWRHSDASESDEKTLSAVGSLAELTSPMAECLPDLHTFKPPLHHGKSTSVIILNTDSQSTSGYSSPTHHNISKGHTPTLSNSSSINGSSNDLGKSLACSIVNTNTSAIISLRQPVLNSNVQKRKSITLVNINSTDEVIIQATKPKTPPKPPTRTQSIPKPEESDQPKNSLYLLEKAQTIDRAIRVNEIKHSCGSLNRLSLGTTGSSSSLWNVKSLLRKKKIYVPPLPPELEGAIIKSESLAYLSDDELLARHERNKQIQRNIEQRIQQQLGQIPSESQC